MKPISKVDNCFHCLTKLLPWHTRARAHKWRETEEERVLLYKSKHVVGVFYHLNETDSPT